MVRSPVHTIAAVASLGAFALAVGGGLYQSLIREGQLPALSLDYAPRLQAMLDAGNVDEVIDQLRIATRLDPNATSAAESLHSVAARHGDLGSQILALRAQVRTAPVDPELRVKLSRAFLAQARNTKGRRAQRSLLRAVFHAEAALELDPGSPPARAARDEARRAIGAPE